MTSSFLNVARKMFPRMPIRPFPFPVSLSGFSLCLKKVRTLLTCVASVVSAQWSAKFPMTLQERKKHGRENSRNNMLSPETRWKSRICAPANCKGQGSYFFSLTVDQGDIGGFSGNPSPHPTLPISPKGNSLDRKPSERILKNCGRHAKV